jgi:AcrR family transcriptional regulator
MVPPRYQNWVRRYETLLPYNRGVARPKLHDNALRVRLLDRAAELLSREGPEALSLRRLAGDVGTSTTAVYSLFGGKPGLLAAVYDEAVRRFGEHLAEVRPTDDPLDDLRRLAQAYRRSALADPHLYGVMFSRRAPGFEPDEAARQRADATFAPLVDAVRRGVEHGALPDEDPVTLATACWAAAHGVVSLELGSYLPASEDLFLATLRALINGWPHR